jgi:predicted transcriptional regulator
MNLSEFLDQADMSPPQFAAEIGIDPQTVRRIIRGYEPSLSVAILIENYTHRLVKGTDLLGKVSKGKGRPKKSLTKLKSSENSDR